MIQFMTTGGPRRRNEDAAALRQWFRYKKILTSNTCKRLRVTSLDNPCSPPHLPPLALQSLNRSLFLSRRRALATHQSMCLVRIQV